MQNLKELMEKYGNVTTENGLMDGVEVDMDPTVGVVETIINGENEEIVKEAIESAAKDAEELEEVAGDAEELEETVETEEKEEEATTESAIRIMDKINQTLEKHGYKSDEEKESMGYSVNSLNTESAQSFPSATKDAAIKAGKSVIEKIKAGVKWIIEKIVGVFIKIKESFLTLLGNNAATARKLQGVLAGLEDKVEEGKEVSIDFGAKFPLASKLDKDNILKSMVAGNAIVVNAVIKSFTDGCAAKSLEKFNSLDGVAGSAEVATLMGVDKAILLGTLLKGTSGNSITAIVVKEGTVKIESKEVEGKAPALTAPLSNGDLKSILSEVILKADASKKFIEDTKGSFEALKNIKVEDEEFAKTAKIESTISTLTNAKMKLLSSLASQPKLVLQFVAANVAVKAKKA